MKICAEAHPSAPSTLLLCNTRKYNPQQNHSRWQNRVVCVSPARKKKKKRKDAGLHDFPRPKIWHQLLNTTYRGKSLHLFIYFGARRRVWGAPSENLQAGGPSWWEERGLFHLQASWWLFYLLETFSWQSSKAKSQFAFLILKCNTLLPGDTPECYYLSVGHYKQSWKIIVDLPGQMHSWKPRKRVKWEPTYVKDS